MKSIRSNYLFGTGVAALGLATTLLTPALTHAQSVTLGWHTFINDTGSTTANIKVDDATPDTDTSGGLVKGSLGKGAWINLTATATGFGGKGVLTGQMNSTDGTYGATVPGANHSSANALTFYQLDTKNFLDFSVENLATVDLTLDGIHFDLRRPNANSANTVDISHLKKIGVHQNPSDLADADGVQIFSATGLTVNSGQTAFLNFDTDFSALTDTTLAPGEIGIFRLRLSDAAGAQAQSQIDNFAITATLIPEPSVLTLLLGVFTVLGHRMGLFRVRRS